MSLVEDVLAVHDWDQLTKLSCESVPWTQTAQNEVITLQLIKNTFPGIKLERQLEDRKEFRKDLGQGNKR